MRVCLSSRGIGCVVAGLVAISSGCHDGGSSIGAGASDSTSFLDHLLGLRERAERAGEAAIPGVGDDLLFVKELRALTIGPFWGENAAKASSADADQDPLPAILDVHRQFRELGIAWVFVPVPAKVAVDPSRVAGAPMPNVRVDAEHHRFYQLLREHGVSVVDLHDEFRALVKAGKRAHCATDTHWSGDACAAAARQIRELVGEAAWLADIDRKDYQVASSDQLIVGDMVEMVSASDLDREKLRLSVVTGPDGVPLKPSRQSPILLFGDSHTLVFHAGADMHARGAGLADHLAAEFGTPVDLVGVRGSGATPSRINVLRGKHLVGKRFAIWCLTMREFSQSKWSSIPLASK